MKAEQSRDFITFNDEKGRALENAKDALMSFAYNLGLNFFTTGKLLVSSYAATRSLYRLDF